MCPSKIPEANVREIEYIASTSLVQLIGSPDGWLLCLSRLRRGPDEITQTRALNIKL